MAKARRLSASVPFLPSVISFSTSLRASLALAFVVEILSLINVALAISRNVALRSERLRPNLLPAILCFILSCLLLQLFRIDFHSQAEVHDLQKVTDLS